VGNAHLLFDVASIRGIGKLNGKSLDSQLICELLLPRSTATACFSNHSGKDATSDRRFAQKGTP
jgi:hypothetical protein